MSARQVGFLSGVPNQPSIVPHFAKGHGRLTRKKHTEASYTSENTNTFRVLGERAEWEKEPDWGRYRSIPRPPPAEQINEPLQNVPFPLKEASVHHMPHSKTATFIRTNVRFLNKPVWFIEPTDDVKPTQEKANCQQPLESKRDFYSASYIGKPGTFQPEPIISTYSDGFPAHTPIRRNTRHGCNHEILGPAHGIVPLNELREKDGQQRVYSETMSFKHQYNSRKNPNIPFGLKKQGAFVWDQLIPEAPCPPNLAPLPMSQEPNDCLTKKPLEAIVPTSSWTKSANSNNNKNCSQSEPSAQNNTLTQPVVSNTETTGFEIAEQ